MYRERDVEQWLDEQYRTETGQQTAPVTVRRD
jgi:hypothetical protein